MKTKGNINLFLAILWSFLIVLNFTNFLRGVPPTYGTVFPPLAALSIIHWCNFLAERF